jgi:hypothetical protein
MHRPIMPPDAPGPRRGTRAHPVLISRFGDWPTGAATSAGPTGRRRCCGGWTRPPARQTCLWPVAVRHGSLERATRQRTRRGSRLGFPALRAHPSGLQERRMPGRTRKGFSGGRAQRFGPVSPPPKGSSRLPRRMWLIRPHDGAAPAPGTLSST